MVCQDHISKQGMCDSERSFTDSMERKSFHLQVNTDLGCTKEPEWVKNIFEKARCMIWNARPEGALKVNINNLTSY